ncbi:response regulator transcription factor [Pedobacter jejuensis]|uniref:Response regulator n=1 Tax=Pedobacter jejuensis TaxID=1268550 RepID=A0A3N0C2I2_9SPHI|nr:response regulator [Pedobacter jejuensis]RNL56646.1 response regulator [Pedobacter jejuensis]
MKGKKISVLEDDEGILEVVEMILSAEGYEVDGFACVNDFMIGNATSIPDIYLLDVMLPDGDGLRICNQLKNQPKTSHVPVVMMSAHADISIMMAQCKADGFISKPFDLNHIINLVGSFR